MKNIIFYIGGFGLPDRNASAQRAIENSRLFQSLGYSVILMGKIKLDNGDKEYASITTSCHINGIECYDIRHPNAVKQYPSYVSNIDSIKDVIYQKGTDRAYAIIAYNYPPVALQKLIKFARHTGIKIITECTEWHGWEGRKLIRNFFRFWLTEYRLRFLAKRAHNIICASRYLQSFYSNYHTVVLPFVVDGAAEKWHVTGRETGSTPRRFIYAGSPGLGLVKDYVHWVVEVFSLIKQAGYEFEFVIIGITRQQILQSIPQLHDKLIVLGENIRFLGRLSHVETIKHVRQSDFFIFLRPQNRVSNVGFPTKLVEAFSCGIPTITNDTSDIGLYVHSGKNGFLLSLPDKEELRSVIIRAIEMDDVALQQMKNVCQTNNPFCFENFQESIREFLLLAK